MAPVVSIVIPAYNRAAYLREAIHSVLSQRMGDVELVIVDDGSTDETAEVVRGFQDKRIRYLTQVNQGRSAARNHGADLAHGEFLGFLDSDDRYLPTALEAHVQALRTRPDLGMTLGGYEYVDEAGQSRGERRPWAEGGSLSLAAWLFNCFGIPGSVLLRRSWFDRVGGFDSECEIAEDWDLFLRFSQAGCSMEWVRQAVCQYRRHTGSSTHALALHRRGALRALDKLFGRPDLPPEVAVLEKRARAWVYVLFSKKAYQHGQEGLAAQNLDEAVRLDPPLARARKTELLEFLLSPDEGWIAAPDGLASAVLVHLPPEIKVKPGDVRRAQARVEMASFFAAIQGHDELEAMPHFQAGLRLDPSWLANRGVLAFGLRALARRLRTRPQSSPHESRQPDPDNP